MPPPPSGPARHLLHLAGGPATHPRTASCLKSSTKVADKVGITPEVGMNFESEEQAFEMYNTYADKSHKLRSQRRVTEADRMLIGQIRDARMKPTQVYKFMKQFYGGADKVDDKDGQIANFFWADGQSIMDYKCFGDAVSFDTTFQTNKFEMPFAPILRTNHHKQTIIFGVALIFNESIESFVMWDFVICPRFYYGVIMNFT
ncbi:protein FAR1-RELATED SEQUENCE 5-like [Setaria viridis]|uniref:protein FAR1-RELATED SEQUENCE 5-like n=1 Tax=Setaria viridis TaxID=4556 RepID=UPI001493AB2F|nr:protein FAR1-RELATED SEQUENCE 5-like [Setaria viridis]